MKKNLVAKILQIYAIINAIGGLVLMFFIADAFDGGIGFLCFAVVLVVSFFIYAFGEVIRLLEEIKNNTSTSKSAVVSDELPEL